MGLPRTLISAFSSWCENEDIKLITAVVKGENSVSLPIGTHVVISERDYESAIESTREQNIRAGSFFPTRFEGSTRQQLTISAAGVVLTDPKKITEDRKVLRIETFDYKKLPEIHEYIKENGALTLVMDNMTGCLNFFKYIDDIRKDFGYASPLGFKRHSDKYTPNQKFEDDIIEMFIDIYDIKYAIPIFNFREAEGLAFNIGFFWRDASTDQKISLIEEYQFAVNKYKSNLLEFDGEKIRKKDYIIDKNYHDHMMNTLRNEITRRKKVESVQKKSEKKTTKCESPEIVCNDNPCTVVTTATKPIPATYREWLEQQSALEESKESKRHEPVLSESFNLSEMAEEIMNAKVSGHVYYNGAGGGLSNTDYPASAYITIRELEEPTTISQSDRTISVGNLRSANIQEVKLFDTSGAPDKSLEIYGSRYFRKMAKTSDNAVPHATHNISGSDGWVGIVPKNGPGDLVMSGWGEHEPPSMYDAVSTRNARMNDTVYTNAATKSAMYSAQYGDSAVSNDSNNKKKKGKGE